MLVSSSNNTLIKPSPMSGYKEGAIMVKVCLSDSGRAREGFAAEKNDCTVRAAVVRFTTSYTRAYELCASVGRRANCGLRLAQIKELLEKMGLPYVEFKKWERPTLAQFIKDHPAGRFYVVIRGHAIGINDGVCIDTLAAKPRARVWLYA